VRQLSEAAARARQRGDTREEVRLLKAVVEIDPDQPDALNTLGMRALAQGEAAAAAGWFERAARADPTEPALWLNVASARRALGDDEGELASLERALAIDQRYFMALYRKAELLERTGDAQKAVAAWRGVLILADGADGIPPAMVDRLETARRFVESYIDDYGRSIDAGLANDRAALVPDERRRFDACIDASLGRRRIYVNECAGLHFPFLPAEEFFERRHFPWLEAFEAHTDAIRQELEALLADPVGMRPYVEQAPGTPENKWSPLDNSPDWTAGFIWEYGRGNAAIVDRCPETVKALAAVPQTEITGRAPTAFFSILRPRSRIPPHTGVTNCRTIIHLPLIVPEGCGLRVGGETRSWQVGEALAFDDTIEHEAWNDSDQLRAVLILDVWNPYLTPTECRLLRRFFELSDDSAGRIGS
jgi:aspartate beta-hydroxylase